MGINTLKKHQTIALCLHEQAATNVFFPCILGGIITSMRIHNHHQPTNSLHSWRYNHKNEDPQPPSTNKKICREPTSTKFASLKEILSELEVILALTA